MNEIEYSIKGAFRIAQTVRAITQTGLAWALGDRPPAPTLLRKTFERLGATYIKLGQFIASSPSFFPGEYVQEFQLCLDQTNPLPFATMTTVLEQELGHLSSIFADIDPQPLASASIAQVHAARLVTGEDVVIKIQKPGVKDVLLTDLNFLYLSARILEFLRPGLSWASLSAIAAEIQKTMMEECDFLKEADNINKFNDFLATTGNDQALAPRVYPHATTLRVLTMERFYGAPLTDLESIRKHSKDPEHTLITAMNTWFSGLLFCEFFHADVHAGNLMVLEDGRVGFLDFGIVGRIAPETWAAMTALLEAVGHSDYKTIAKAMVKMGVTKETVDDVRLAGDVETLFKSLETLHPDEQEINRLLLDIIALGERHGLHFPREFALLLKQFLYFDRYVQILAPDLNVYADKRIAMMPGASVLG